MTTEYFISRGDRQSLGAKSGGRHTGYERFGGLAMTALLHGRGLANSRFRTGACDDFRQRLLQGRIQQNHLLRIEIQPPDQVVEYFPIMADQRVRDSHYCRYGGLGRRMGIEVAMPGHFGESVEPAWLVEDLVSHAKDQIGSRLLGEPGRLLG